MNALRVGPDPTKCATGIFGLDEVTGGGLPTGRVTLVLGGPGCGKTLLGAEFLAHGCSVGEPGVMVSVEQSHEHLCMDVRSIGIDVEALERQGALRVVAVELHQQEFAEVGSFTLDGLWATIDREVRATGARRVVIDQLDGFFAHFQTSRALRIEFCRLARLLSERGLTTVMVGSPPGGVHRMEEYLSDCVIRLDHRITNQVGTRRLHVMKYRGTAHGTDEYPFAITKSGLRVFPITSSKLDYDVSEETLSTGIRGLDEMLGGGYYRGCAVMISGQAGTGKTTLACQLAAHAAAAGLKSLYFSFEESPKQLFRNAKSVGIDLRRVVDDGSLSVAASRPTVHGLEQHLGELEDAVAERNADLVVIDPITNLIAVGSSVQVKAMITRLVDALRRRQVTVVFTSLVLAGDESYGAGIGVSSLMDVIVALENRLEGADGHRVLSVRKSRGKPSLPGAAELRFTENGIEVTAPTKPARSQGRTR